MSSLLAQTAPSLPAEAPTAVAELMAKARHAQQAYECYTQAQVDEVVTAVGWALIQPENNQLLAEQAVLDTGLGNVADKIKKNHRKTLGLLRDLKDAPSVGVVAEYPEKGLIEIARPVGVVGAVVPSTNPVATPFNKTLNALKGRNAIILAPSPKGQKVCAKLIELIHVELKRVGAPLDLVQQLPLPVNKALTQALMAQVDLVVVTGSQSNVRQAYSSGTPAVGVGAGNVPVIVDEGANLPEAAAKIVCSKIFDNATSCSSENSLVILEKVYAPMLAALQAEGGVVLDSQEKERLQALMWHEGKINREVIAKDAKTIARLANLPRALAHSPKLLMVEEEKIGPDVPFSDEKLSPVLTLYRVPDFEAAFQTMQKILAVQGLGHSVGIHTNNPDHVMRLGLEMPTCRVIVNQAHCFANGGSFDNGLPFSLSMGCGTWGRNSISENMNYRHYLNTTRIVRAIPPKEPTEKELFGAYWEKYHLQKEQRAGSHP